MRITSKGQVTIPQAVREQAGLMPGTDVEFAIDGDTVRVVKANRQGRPSKVQQAVARFRGSGSKRWTSEELMQLLRPEHR